MNLTLFPIAKILSQKSPLDLCINYMPMVQVWFSSVLTDSICSNSSYSNNSF